MINILHDKPLVILEFANNHMGDEKLFEIMVDEYSMLASEYSDFKFAIKLQYRDLETFIHPSYKGGEHSGVQRFESTRVTIDEWSFRIDYALSKGLLIGCTPFDEVSVEQVLNDKRFSFLKIGSCSFNDWPLLEKIRNELKERDESVDVIASTGGMTLDTVDHVVSFLTKSPNIDLSLMHCIAEYPSSTDNQNLAWINTLSERYQKNVGFSTHETGDEEFSGAFSYCMGASIFEKHVVSSNATTVNAYSANPDQVRRWLDRLLEAKKYIGCTESRVSLFANENKYLNAFRRGVFVQGNITDTTLTNDDVYMAFPRSEDQLTANEWSKFMKCEVKDTLQSDMPVIYDSVKINDTRSKIEEIRLFTGELLRTSRIVVDSGTRLEISHHYGLERYDEVGLAMITLVNLEYCKKLMLIKAGQFHPEQYHKVKRETFIVLHGEIELTLDGVTSKLKPGQIETIDPGVVHSFSAVVDSVIEEISSTHATNDSYYVDDKILANTNRKSYVSLFD